MKVLITSLLVSSALSLDQGYEEIVDYQPDDPLRLVQSITPETGLHPINPESIVFVQYEDRESEQYHPFDNAFEAAALHFKSDLVRDQVGPTEWFTVDTWQYPEMENEQHSKTIAGPGKQFRTGGSYVLVVIDGFPAVLDFDLDLQSKPQTQEKSLIYAINSQVLQPVLELEKCAHIKELYQEDYLLVWFGTQDIFESPFNSLYEVARRELVLYGDERVLFYKSASKKCAKTWGVSDLNRDAAIFFPGVGLPPLLKDREFTPQSISAWLNTAISDVEQVFSKRVVYGTMHNQLASLVFLRQFGKPDDFGPYQNRGNAESTAIIAFRDFTKSLQFKQQRVMFFYSDPQIDTPLDETTIESFYQIEASSVPMPNLMLVLPKQGKVSFFGPLEDVSIDSLAVWMYQTVFKDLDTSGISNQGSEHEMDEFDYRQEEL